jgi:hypothetical protein
LIGRDLKPGRFGGVTLDENLSDVKFTSQETQVGFAESKYALAAGQL